MAGTVKYIKRHVKKTTMHLLPIMRCGVSGNSDYKTIVSLTSFPKRIKSIHLCIKTLLKQSYKPDAVILWLANTEFPGREDDLPKELLKLKKYGLTIKWCENIRSYKKLVPALKEYPDATVITADDDVYYVRSWLEKLIRSYKEHPDEICCYRAAKISFSDEGEFVRSPVGEGICYPTASYLNQQTGIGGVLYPARCLATDVTRDDVFMKIAPTNDDIWFWAMGILNGKRIRVIENNTFIPYYVGDTQDNSLTSINDSGEMLYYKQLYNVFNKYPTVLERLKQEHGEFMRTENNNEG